MFLMKWNITSMFKLNTKNYKVLTPDGYKGFLGVQKLNKPGCEVYLKNGTVLRCSNTHPLCTDVHKYTFELVCNFKPGDKVFHHEDGWVEIDRIIDIGNIDVYDLVDVETTVAYYTNGILSHNCIFVNSGESSINEELFAEMSQQCKDPKIILEEGNYKIWEEPDSTRVYVAGVDISEGVGIDASVIQMLDITDLKDIRQVAVYHNRNIPPLEFANKVYTVLKNWGSPLALIERNNCGAQVVDRLAFDMGYEKVVSYGAKVANRSKSQMGMIAHTNTKYKGVMNMRYFLNEIRAVTIVDIETLKELKDFVRYPNGSWKAKGGYHDDRVMSLMYSLFILEKEITERYFDILELDDHGKPCSIEPVDFGVAMFEEPTSIYNDFEVMGLNNTYITPIVFGMGNTDQIAEIDFLKQEGWSIYE